MIAVILVGKVSEYVINNSLEINTIAVAQYGFSFRSPVTGLLLQLPEEAVYLHKAQELMRRLKNARLRKSDLWPLDSEEQKDFSVFRSFAHYQLRVDRDP